MYVQSAPWTAAFLAIFVVAFFSGVLFVGAGAFLSSPVVIQWAGALATFLAAVVAIGIALHTQESATLRRSNEAALIAARHFATLHFAKLEIDKAALYLSDPMDPATLDLLEEYLSKANALAESVPIVDLYAYDPALAAHMVQLLDALRVSIESKGASADRREEFFRRGLEGCMEASKAAHQGVVGARHKMVAPWTKGYAQPSPAQAEE